MANKPKIKPGAKISSGTLKTKGKRKATTAKISTIWTPLYGVWNESKGTWTQSDLTGVTRCWHDVGSTNFIAQFKFCMTQCAPQNNGEGKFILTDADVRDPNRGERWRIDFLYGRSQCRIFADGVTEQFKVSLAQNKLHTARIELKDKLVSVDLDGTRFVTGYNIGQASNGHVGIGTYRAAVEFKQIIVEPYLTTKCFIVMPFDKYRDIAYDSVIEPGLREHPTLVFEFERADKLLTAGKISKEIEDRIKAADVIIADITGNNPNVLYELGLARGARKKIILLIEKVKGQKLDIPFDIADFRCHHYEYSTAGFKDLKERLTGLLSNVLKS
jgi:hypothetical protein